MLSEDSSSNRRRKDWPEPLESQAEACHRMVCNFDHGIGASSNVGFRRRSRKGSGLMAIEMQWETARG
jgi:hypothetical protein